MTIRDFLKRRTRIYFGMLVAGWLICAASVLLFAGGPCGAGCSHGRSKPPLGFLLGLPLFAGAMVGMVFFVKCPRCSGRLGQFTMQAPFSIGRQINFCPYCGINFDESMPP